MVTPPLGVDVVTIASVTSGVALFDLAAAIATLQPIVAASSELVVGAVIAVDAPAGTTSTTCPHPSTGSLATRTVVSALAGTTVGTVAGHPLTGFLFLAANTSAPLAPPLAPSGPWTLPPLLAPS
jgi:hypothetical protein